MENLNIHELNISELRKQKRPLWMSDLGIDNYADILGGGGDIYTDRLPPAFARYEVIELSGRGRGTRTCKLQKRVRQRSPAASISRKGGHYDVRQDF